MAIHAFGVVHRDLKPSNIIIASDGPRVIDFGIARALEMASLTSPSVVLGTPSFMSPEQVLAREHGPPGDVFALGSVLTFAATGRGAFGEGHPWAVLNNIVQAEPDLADVPDKTLRDVIAACLAKEPGDRPGLEELLTWLLDPAPTPQAWLPPAVRDLTRQLLGEGREPRRPGPGRTDPPAARSAHPRLVRNSPGGRHRHGAVQPVRPGRPPLPGAAGLCAGTASRAAERSGGQAQHRPADRRGVSDAPIAPLRGRAQRRPALHLEPVALPRLDRRLPDTSSRDLAHILWKSIDQFIAAAKDLEPIRHLSDAHARNVATAFAEASAALYAAADVNVPDAGSVFDDHN